jgi:hypothetical protein
MRIIGREQKRRENREIEEKNRKGGKNLII